MTGVWKLNGLPMDAVEVRIMPTSASLRQNVRQDLEEVHGGTQYRERTGKDLPRKIIEIIFLDNTDSDGTEKWDELAEIMDILEDDDVWTLEAPQDYFVYKNFERASFSTVSIDQNDDEGNSKLTLRIEAIVNGIWIADGGDYCRPVSGYFTRNAGPTYTRDDGTNTGSTPLLRLPLQSTGYPSAVKDDYTMGTPTLVSTQEELDADGNLLVYGLYLMTGFLVPAPAATGDVGVYQVCSSPTSGFLGAGFPETTMDSLVFGEASASGVLVFIAASSMDIFAFGEASAASVLSALVSSTMDTFAFDDIDAVASLTQDLLAEDSQNLLTEASENLLAEE